MKIGFDAKQAVQNTGDEGNYGRYVIEIMSDYFSGSHYVCFAPKNKKNNRLRTIRARKDVSFVFPRGIFRLCASLWRLFRVKRLIKKRKIAVFHGLCGELPTGIEKTGVKTVVSVYDLIFLRYPEYYNPLERKMYYQKMKRACEKADKIIAVSARTKRDIIVSFEILSRKIEVIYPGCQHNFKETVAAKKKKKIGVKYNLPDRFLLFVGRIEARKNLLLAVKALSKIPEDVHLVAVGESTSYQAEVKAYANKNGLSSRLHILNNVAYEDLPAIYQLATLFVYPSFFEGFSISVVEALSCGVPVITATGSGLEEAGGPDSIYIDPHDEEELADEINTVLSDKELADSMIATGKRYAKQFSEKATAEHLMKIYKSLQDY
ncbi:glycosyl transferase family 1 [Bacteroidia bacterium]|nr:glycosyl transferase family 1 [Bacteroidia bacterium]